MVLAPVKAYKYSFLRRLLMLIAYLFTPKSWSNLNTYHIQIYYHGLQVYFRLVGISD